MIEIKAVIKNSNGIHCRPSAVILKSIDGYPGKIFITFRKEEILLNSIINLLSLGLTRGSEIQIKVDGPNEEKAGKNIRQLFELEYDFPPKEQHNNFDPAAFAKELKLSF